MNFKFCESFSTKKVLAKTKKIPDRIHQEACVLMVAASAN